MSVNMFQIHPVGVTDLKSQMQKTKLCEFFPKGKCKYGSRCTYAHSQREIKPAPALVCKTQLCERFLIEGTCTDPKCNYAHGKEELVDHFYKTVLCKDNRRGACANGDECRFAHSVRELRPKPVVAGPGGPRSRHHVPSIQKGALHTAHKSQVSQLDGSTCSESGEWESEASSLDGESPKLPHRVHFQAPPGLQSQTNFAPPGLGTPAAYPTRFAQDTQAKQADFEAATPRKVDVIETMESHRMVPPGYFAEVTEEPARLRLIDGSVRLVFRMEC